jgi:hypothetical protein
MKPSNRGGKREGAGRKPLSASEKRITKSVNLEGDAWIKIYAKASLEGVSASEIVNRWAKRLRL